LVFWNATRQPRRLTLRVTPDGFLLAPVESTNFREQKRVFGSVLVPHRFSTNFRILSGLSAPRKSSTLTALFVMAYAIVQKELVVPEVEQLQRAFRVSPDLTRLDAQTAANDAYGILLRGVDPRQADALRDALLRERVEIELVEESKLPVIPSARIIQQVEFHVSHVTLYDPMRRAAEVAWRDIVFIAAGYVRMREVRRHCGALDEPGIHSTGIGQETSSTSHAREEEHIHMVLEIFASGGTRYSLSADEFIFDHLGARLSNDLAMNFVSLVQDLAREAPHAGLNRGAFKACQQPPELFPYPSKAAFNEELTWMLWRIAQLRLDQVPQARA
jgi:hypothetical protein